MSSASRSGSAVLDIGKTNARLCAVDDRGRVLSGSSRASACSPSPPYSHHDVESLFGWIVGALEALSLEFDLDAIVPVAHGATAALLAGDRLALPVLDYEHEIDAESARRYDLRARDFARTGSPGLPAGLNLGRQLFWQAERFPEEFATITDVLPYPQYWAYRLGGEKVSEVTSLGCHTDLWEPGARRWSAFVRESGWEPLFPRLVLAWSEVGAPSAEVRARARLPSDCRILAGIHDSNASFLAHRAHRRSPFAVVSTGTWVVCMAHGADLANLREEADMLANVDAFGDPVPSARFMGGREYAAIAGDSGLAIDPTAADALEVVASPAMALPAFAADGGPFRDRVGRVVGAETLGPRGRAALAAVYCALLTDRCLDLLDVRGDLVVEGRFVRNDAYCATLAGLRPEQAVLVSSDETGSLAGAAVLAALRGGGDVRSLDRSLDPVAPLEPARLDAYRRIWRDRSESIKFD